MYSTKVIIFWREKKEVLVKFSEKKIKITVSPQLNLKTQSTSF